MISSKITGTGTFIPSVRKKNKDFLNEDFLNEDGTSFSLENDVIIEKFKGITGIDERRYAKPEYTTSMEISLQKKHFLLALSMQL